MNTKNIYETIDCLESLRIDLLFRIEQMEKVLAMLKKDAAAELLTNGQNPEVKPEQNEKTS